MRWTELTLMPTVFAIMAAVQWVVSAGGSVSVSATTTAAGKTTEQILASAHACCRDNARTPVQWSDEPHAGFTSGLPWIEVNGNHREINVAADATDPDGVLAHYRRLIALRRDLDIVSHGRFIAHAEDHPAVLAYLPRDR